MGEMDEKHDCDKDVSETENQTVYEFTDEPKSNKKKNKKKIFKKWWFWVIITFAVIGIITGANNSTDDGDPEDALPGVCEHSYELQESDATCTLGGYDTYKCSKCSKTRTEYKSALGHTTSEGTCERCGKSFGTWKITFYVDEFKNPTDEAYVTNSNVFYGKFSNSATTNSNLQAQILIDADGVAVKLWEYGSLLVDAYTSTSYKVTVLDDNQVKHHLTGIMYKGGDRIHLADRTLVDLLSTNTEVQIYIEEVSNGVNSTYLFTVKCGNFGTIYQEFCSKHTSQ